MDTTMKVFGERQSETDETPELGQKTKWKSWTEKAVFFIENITVEPLIFLVAVAATMQGVVIQALVLEQSCLTEYGFSREYCSNVTNITVKRELEGIVTDFNLYGRILETTPYLLLTLFVGAWSDQHGPKLLVFISLIADSTSAGIYAWLAYLRSVRPEFALIGRAIKGITGNDAMFYLAVINYLIVNSTDRSRTTRLMFVETAFLVGAPLGLQLGGWLYGTGNYALVFLVSMCIYLSAIPYAAIRLKNLPAIVGPASKALRGVFKLQHLKDGVLAATKKRPGRKRLYIFISIICAKMILFAASGDETMRYPYAQLVFKFTVKLYSTYDTFVAGTILIGTLIGLPVMSYVLGISDIILGLTAVFMMILYEILIANSISTLMLFLSSTLCIFFPAGHVVCRSLMSKCVSEDEQGKLIALYGLLSAGLPILSAFVYDRLFRATMATFPAACFYLSAIIYALPAAGFIWVYYDMKKHKAANESETQDEVILLENELTDNEFIRKIDSK